MSSQADQAPHTFLTLLPTSHIAHVAPVIPDEAAVDGLVALPTTHKTRRSSSATTSDSTTTTNTTISPRSSLDAGVVDDAKKSAFLKLGS